MTQPRRHLEGQTVMMSRRTLMGFFFLRPDESINEIMRYETAKAARRHGQAVHGVVAMSNSVRFVATDTTGDRSDFMRDAMSGVARARNDSLNRKGTFWGAGQFGETVTLDGDALERRLVQAWLAPVVAGLVEHVEDWPGFQILPKHWGETIEVNVPDRFYGRNSPETVEFTPQPPPGYEDRDLEEVKQYFQQLIEQKEAEIHAAHPERRYDGVNAVRGENPRNRPDFALPEPQPTARYDAGDPELQKRAESRHQTFVDEYETARQRWLKGRETTFPAGTVQLKRCAPVRCASVGPDEPGLLAEG